MCFVTNIGIVTKHNETNICGYSFQIEKWVQECLACDMGATCDMGINKYVPQFYTHFLLNQTF